MLVITIYICTYQVLYSVRIFKTTRGVLTIITPFSWISCCECLQCRTITGMRTCFPTEPPKLLNNGHNHIFVQPFPMIFRCRYRMVVTQMIQSSLFCPCELYLRCCCLTFHSNPSALLPPR